MLPESRLTFNLGFKSEQEFYDFYTKNFYQKATSGRSYESAKADWEKTRK